MHTGEAIAKTKCFSAFTVRLSIKKKILAEHLRFLEEAKERDHRKIGQRIELVHELTKGGARLADVVAKRRDYPPDNRKVYR